ncbi:MAG: helix-turn-helix transcriptional regulator [Chloroflexi bacterium]|nr:MAG: helix-turn-helix transcriptional regulator [Chloroflexota bacterium]TMD84663.1 MAG: helix-turn-helix transcriptional regulator [Chloroflexota bacterium]
MVSGEQSGASSSRSVLFPYGLAGDPRELTVAGLCAASLGIVLLMEMLTPDAVVESFELPPVLVASWLMSNRVASFVGAAAVVVFGIALVTESANRRTVIVVGIVTLLTALVARVYASRLVGSIHTRAEHSADRQTPTAAMAKEGGAALSELAAPLTPRELRVARLAAQGYTAAQIANELHIGDRTVESHLASTYSKLGIRSKGELIRMASTLEQQEPAPEG